MTSQQHIQELAAREFEVQRTLEHLQRGAHGNDERRPDDRRESAEAYHSIQEAADALRAATQVVRHCHRADVEELQALSDDERQTFEASRRALLCRLSNPPELPESDI